MEMHLEYLMTTHISMWRLINSICEIFKVYKNKPIANLNMPPKHKYGGVVNKSYMKKNK